MNRTRTLRARALPSSCALAVVAAAILIGPWSVSAQVIIAGNDSKARLKDGQLNIDPAGEQSVSVIDLSAQGAKLRATIPVPNSIFGPPTNLQVTPDDKLALVAEAVVLNEDQSKFVPSDKLRVIDLEANPPRVIATITVGKQPSGLSIRPDGKMALVANRGETSVSVLSINGKSVEMAGKVEVKDQPAHVAFFPNGKRALVNKSSTNQVAFLDIDGMNVTYSEHNIPVGVYPYNADITPDGSLALVANTGNNGRSDGNKNSLSVIDLQAPRPHVIATLSSGDAPEGIVVSPRGNLAVTGNLCGTDGPPDAWFYRAKGCISLYSIEGKRVSYLGDMEAGGVPEALAFSPDGNWLLVANLLDQDVIVFKVNGTKLVNTNKNLSLPGRPGAMRGRAR